MPKSYTGVTKSKKKKKKSDALKQKEAREKKAKDKYKKKTGKKKPEVKKTKPKVNHYDGMSWKPQQLKAHAPIMLPETELTRKGLNLRTIMRNTPKLFVNNAQFVGIIDIKKAKTKTRMPAIIATLLTDDPNQLGYTKVPRKCHIIGLDKDSEGNPALKKPVNKHKRVLVQCSCQGYVYFGGEYANAVHGAARIIYGSGDPPLFTNPRMVPHGCKHLFALSKYIILKNL